MKDNRNLSELKEEINQLRKSQEGLLAANKDLLRFSHLVAHDLKAPLRNLNFYHHLMQEHIGEPMDNELKECFEDAGNIMNRMNTLINGLLDYAKLSKELCFNDTVDTNLLFESLEKIFKGDITKMQAVITFQGEAKITGNEDIIYQLFHNLVDNAFKYRRADKTPKIEIYIDEHDKHWKFSIKDNGIGIDKKYHERVFQAFERLHHREEYEGRGLGLDFCQKVVHLHHGKIWVDSSLGKGSNFQFTLAKHVTQDK